MIAAYIFLVSSLVELAKSQHTDFDSDEQYFDAMSELFDENPADTQQDQDEYVVVDLSDSPVTSPKAIIPTSEQTNHYVYVRQPLPRRSENFAPREFQPNIPKEVPFCALPIIASITGGWACPKIMGPHEAI